MGTLIAVFGIIGLIILWFLSLRFADKVGEFFIDKMVMPIVNLFKSDVKKDEN
jgi:spore maturation protein SpmA